MVPENEKKRLPSMPASSWWALRKRLRSTMPAKLTSSYLATALNMSENSANNNVLPSLKMTGLIDEENKPTDRAVKWRDDSQYSQVCEEIREEVYPRELLDLAPDADFDRASVQSWVANHSRVGENAAGKITAFYALLSEADPSKETSGNSEEGRGKLKKSAQSKSSEQKPIVLDDKISEPPMSEKNASQLQPSLHIDVQIHISPESSPEQIDQIFASMSKHLKNLS